MSNQSLFQRFNALNQQANTGGQRNMLSQFMNLKNNPSQIVDMLLQSGKITQQQYAELQQYKNNPEQIGMYLMNHGAAPQLNYLIQQLNNIKGGA